jgi:DNA-binding CsgD family transcriptional regulator
MVGKSGEVRVIGVPVHTFAPYQAIIIGAGVALEIDDTGMLGLDRFCTEAIRRLLDLGFISRERPGDLSPRERRVVELAASGRTASEIADMLDISQRTVHAHLQNASVKLKARNKTHTVAAALHYGQIKSQQALF